MSKSSPSDSSYEARLEAVLESVSDAFYALDADWRFVVFNRAAEEYFGVAREAVLGRDLWEVFPQGAGTPFEAYCRAAMNEAASTSFETSSRLRPDRVVELRIVPMRGGGVAISLTDITERKSADARQRLLANELNHRVKNSLATVQAIAAQSLRGPDVSPVARERFMARLVALARANDVLVAEAWNGASLASVAAEMANPHGDGERFTIAGPEVHLAPQTATAMAMGLHELATNAAKYGALSTPEGRVSLTWDLAGEGAARRLKITWRETGGPPVGPPGQPGFGSRLIERGLASELKANVRLVYAPAGVVFSLSAPLSESVVEG
ncbi:sensor histidine kinase [Phenylobacterium sp.]|jgi:PAS domain S-box-containing protein|uniref:sensor histidine kinase n=1 Tax=Phenylobacterium sp. TaxID=1871053 RepID=UPI002E34D84B|nr:HWE histidine kinase domain-containing protein [Phenylobacterium sp.]HEX3366627.1 HWE histidine kinase domain-containing protein [Phenylobacterium sp.]